MAFDGLTPQVRLSPLARSDVLPKENEEMRNFITYGLSGMVGKQECLNRALCQLGDLIAEVKGKSIAFM